MRDGGARGGLIAVLERAQRRGFLGPGAIAEHLVHAEAMARFVGTGRVPVLDLGSGGGVPGLVLACLWQDARVTLIDASRRRTEHLEAAVVELGLEERVDVVYGRAEMVAREPRRRTRYGLVVARGFGPPAVTAECAIGFLRPGGALVVSEPPGGAARWPAERVGELGFRVARRSNAGPAFVELVTDEGPAVRWPRRNGVPGKRPLWS